MLVFLLGMFILLLVNYHYFSNHYREYEKETYIRTVNEVWQKHLAHEYEKIESTLQSLAKNEQFARLLRDGDREKLHELTAPLLETLNKNDITHLYYYTPDSTVFLRGYRPDRYGDISERHILQLSQEKEQLVSGLEAGRHGSITMRSVAPLHLDGEIVGYLELGADYEHAIEEITSAHNVELVFLVHQDYLAEIDLDHLPGEETEGWLPVNEFYRRYTSLAIEDELCCQLGEHFQWQDDETEIHELGLAEHEGVSYYFKAFPVADAAGRPLGLYLLGFNASQRFAMLDQVITFSLGIMLLVLFAGLATGFVFVHQAVSPLLFFKNSVKKITKDQDLGQRVSISGGEIGELTDNFNQLLERLRRTSVSREYMSALLENMNEMLFVLDENLNIQTINSALLDKTGFERSELINEPGNKIIAPESFKKLFEQAEEISFDSQRVDLFSKEGDPIPALIAATSFESQTGKTNIICVARDLETIEQLENELQETTQRLELATRATGLGVWQWEVGTDKVNWDDQVKQLLGRKEESYQNFLDGIVDSDRERVKEAIENTVETNEPYHVEFQYRDGETGELRWLDAGGGIHEFPGYENSVMLGTVMDITERKMLIEKLRSKNQELDALVQQLDAANQQLVAQNQQLLATEQQLRSEVEERKKVEDRLRETRNFLKTINEITDIGGWKYELDTGELHLTDNLKRLFDLHPEAELSLEEALEFYPPEDRKKVEAKLEKCIEDRKHYELEHRLFTAEERERWGVSQGEAIVEDGEVVAVHGTYQDITERKEREAELKKLTRAIEHSPATVVITDTSGAIEYANPRFEEVTGYKAEEVIGSNPRLLKSGYHDENFFWEMWSTIKAGEIWRGEFCNKKKDGELYWEDASIAPVKNSDGEVTHFIKIGEDITRQREARQNLLRLNNCFLSFSAKPEENFERLTAAAGELLEADSCLYNRLHGDKLRTVAGWQLPEDFAEECEAEGHICGDLIRAEKSDIELIHNLSESSYANTDSHVQEYDLETYIGKVIFLRGEATSSLCAVYSEKTEVSDEKKTMLQIIASALEVEEERRRTMEELQKSNRELQEFANVAAHDLKQPLRTISSYLELLERRYGEELDPRAAEYVDIAVNGAYNMKNLLDDLLEYSRLRNVDKSLHPVSLDAVLEDVQTNLRQSIKEHNAKIIYNDLPEVLGNRAMLRQLFQNLISNAISYRSDDPPEISITAEISGNRWWVCVSDNGIGMEPEYTERVFKIFERLHTDDEIPGTGIGLAICRRIINHHGGRIWAESEPGMGTDIYFTLPKVESTN